MEKTNEIKGMEQAQSPEGLHAHHHQQQSPLARAGYFFLHFLEMCIAMCVSFGILIGLSIWAGPLIGYSNAIRQLPELYTLVLALWLTLVMIGWMRFRGHEWRPTIEMASTSIVALILLIPAGQIGIIPKSSLPGLECTLACAFMFVPMLLRLDHYAASHASHQHHTHSAHEGI